jgi:chromosome segregation ATPase
MGGESSDMDSGSIVIGAITTAFTVVGFVAGWYLSLRRYKDQKIQCEVERIQREKEIATTRDRLKEEQRQTGLLRAETEELRRITEAAKRQVQLKEQEVAQVKAQTTALQTQNQNLERQVSEMRQVNVALRQQVYQLHDLVQSAQRRADQAGWANAMKAIELALKGIDTISYLFGDE